jgi:hypothetical protein
MYTGEMREAYKIFDRKYEGIQGIYVGRMILKWNFVSYGGRVWNGPVGESNDNSNASACFINKGEFLQYLSKY